ncbi:MAG TPA: A/G-specific adenine glycosylase [Lachnospiraceae bacterium]|nr:A/G-specific adenine glycosylase [Lachnospiraceae bacterium]
MKKLVQPLLSWYDNHARVLPWREEPTPYRVWVSEIMLQQTRVEAVKPYFERFIKALPTVEELSNISEDELLKLWEGLGYYNRARNLQKAAKKIMTEYNGCVPDEYDDLLKLPGIGSYTAGAVSSIAFGKGHAAVDGNVLRVFARVNADDSNVLNSLVKKSLEKRIEEIIPLDRAGAFNQALMELGAMICVPNGTPKCVECPWQAFCIAKEQGNILDYPKKISKKARTIEEKTILIIRDENKTAIRKRPNKGLLAGMYEFPTLEGIKNTKAVIAYVKQLGLEPIRVQKLNASKHIFSHKEWHMIGYSIRVDELQEKSFEHEKNHFLFVDPKETEDKYPIPSAFLAYTNYLNIKLGNTKFREKEIDEK